MTTRAQRTASPIILPGSAVSDSGGLLVSIHGGWLDSRLPLICKALTAMDHELELVASVDELTRAADHYELYWRRMFVARWGPHEVGQIISDVHAMRVDRPGKVSLAETVRKRNEAKVQAERQKSREVLAEFTEYAGALIAERENGRHFHGQAGIGEGKRRKKR